MMAASSMRWRHVWHEVQSHGEHFVSPQSVFHQSPLLFMTVRGETVSEVRGRISLVSQRVFASASTMVMVELYLFVVFFLTYSSCMRTRNKR